MGTPGGPYEPFIAQLRELQVELRAREAETKNADEKTFLQHIIREVDRKVVKQIETFSAPVYGQFYDVLLNIDHQLGGTAVKRQPPPPIKLDDIVLVEADILATLENIAGIGHFPAPNPGSTHINHRALLYLDVIANVLADKLAKQDFHALIAPGITQLLWGAHHFATIGYLDVIYQAIAIWKNKPFVRPQSATDETDCFVVYLTGISSIL